jgi:hypothetical protein
VVFSYLDWLAFSWQQVSCVYKMRPFIPLTWWTRMMKSLPWLKHWVVSLDDCQLLPAITISYRTSRS